MGRTLLDKIWDAHTVRVEDGGRCVLYIDRQYIHEVTSPVAFAGLERRGIGVARPAQITATADHNIPTVNQHLPIAEPESRRQVEALAANCARFGIEHFGVGDPRQGIVHIIGPELGFTQPGMTIVCGDSHTSTHGAFGAVAFGIGTSEVEMVFASQCILQPKPKTMRITVNGKRVDIPSYRVKAGDVVAVGEKFRDLLPIKEALISSERFEVPGWLEVDIEKLSGNVLALPTREQISGDINEQLIVELYSK